jgi:RNA polymerase sigma-70 factor (ECF subfamily)
VIAQALAWNQPPIIVPEARDAPKLEMTQPELSEEELLQRVARRDSRAFDQLYEALAPRLFGLMRQMLHDEKEAEEMLQDGFVHVWEHASSYDVERCKAFTWAVMIFRHKAIDRMRALGRRNRRVDSETLQQVTFPASAPVEDDESPASTRGKLVHTALGELPKDERRLIECAFLKGLTHHILSESLGVPPETVKTSVRRGLMRLRDLLRKGGF